MIRINLIRGKRKKRREFNADVLYLLVPILILAGLFFFHRMQTGRVAELQSGIQRANVEVERLRKEIGEVEKFKARKAELQRKVDVIGSLQTGRTGPVRVLDALSDSIPEKCWIEALEIKGGNVKIKGVAASNDTVAGFMTALGQSGRFRDVVLGTAEQTTVTNRRLVKFDLTFTVAN
jgi:type IV pilus assembly protein PilN